MKKIFLDLFVVSFFGFLFASSVSLASAQTSLGTQVYLTTNPVVPEAEKLITVSLAYPLSDLSRATIAWYVNDVLQSQGVGQTSVAVPMGKVGERTLVGVSINTQEGKLIIQSIALIPSSIDILWETKTHTPPLYKGKALPSKGSTLRLTAVPTFIRNGNAIDPKTLYYSWEANGRALNTTTKGGYAMEVPFDTNATRMNISVSVSTGDKTITGKEIISIPQTTPEVVFYENNLVSGVMYNKALPETYSPQKKSISLLAEPFFIPARVFSSGSFVWSVDGKEATPEEGLQFFAFSQTGSVLGGVSNTLEFSITDNALVGGILKKALLVKF